MHVHPTAIIDPGARIAPDVCIGAYCIVGAGVQLEAGTVLHPHASVLGDTQIGPGTQIHPHAAIGVTPQDKKYRGEPTQLRIGARNIFRENVTVSIGTLGGGGLTRIGDDGLFMAGVHVGHDCLIGNGVILANGATLAGHVSVEDGAVLGGLCAVHQFSRIGRGAMIGGLSGVERDVIPYGLVTGNRAALQGLNLIGLQRSGLDKEGIRRLNALYKYLFVEDGPPLSARLDAAPALAGDLPQAQEMVRFLQSPSDRGFTTA